MGHGASFVRPLLWAIAIRPFFSLSVYEKRKDVQASVHPLPPIHRSAKPGNHSVKNLDITFMAANAVGIILYLVLASRG
jgi:hypothetical protein